MTDSQTPLASAPRLGLVGRQRRRIDRILRRRRSVVVPGKEPLPIDELISPLRYDVLVREQYLRFVGEHLDLYDADVEDFLARSQRHPYRRWFDAVAVHRIRPGAEGRAVLDGTFEERIHKTVRLYRTITGEGFDARYPIVVRSAGPVVTTTTGKTLSGRLFPSDGCHRLALLRLLGHRQLPPAWYRLQTEPGWRPPDNTHTLITSLGLTPEEHCAFLSLGYADTVCTDPAELLGHVAATRPARLPELREVLRVDGPLLHGG